MTAAPMDGDPAFLAHYVRVLVAEAGRRRRQHSFHATLLEWAANGRRRYAAAKAQEALRRPAAQLDLFGGKP